MDRENVLTLTGDMDSLNKDLVEWQRMSFDMRKRSDDASIFKYGMNNTELYYYLKKNIELAQSDKEALDEAVLSTEELSDRMNKINRANDIMYNTGEIIICPWIIDNVPDYTMETLTKLYNQYIGLFGDLKTRSDFDSQNIWGHNVHDMYNIMVSRFRDLKDKQIEEDKYKLSISQLDHTIREQSQIVQDICKEDNILAKKVAKLDCISAISESNMYQQVQLERIIEECDLNSKVDYSKDIPMVTPWLTPDEYEELNGEKVDPYTYIFGKEVGEMNQQFRSAMYDMSIDPSKEQDVMKLGWNPSVEYTPETVAYARQRQIKWFNENKAVQIIDISEYDVLNKEDTSLANPKIELYPVYITLLKHDGLTNKGISLYTGSRYSHAGISFDESMSAIYSFSETSDDGDPGFVIDSIEYYKKVCKNPFLKVMCIFVDNNVKNKMVEIVNYYVKNKRKTKYDVSNLFRVILNKTKDSMMSLNMICSQFVDNLLKMCNIDLTGKPSNLALPADFDKPKMPSKVFILFDGPLYKYKPKKVKDRVDRLLTSDLNPSGLSILPVVEAVNKIYSEKNLSNFYINTGNKDADKVLSEIRELLTPTPVVEARQLPVRFGKKGDLYLDMPKDLEREYQEAHRLLESYDESNIQGIKHQLARLFYLNSILEKKISKCKDGDPSYKKMVDLRARVLNDFHKYMKVVQKAEPNFDFEAYMKNSEYYNKTVKIDRYTLKYTGKVIKDFVKTMISA